MRHLAVLLLLVPGVAAGLSVHPETVEAGQTMFFTVSFPDDATGNATLDVGDGRTETVRTELGSVDVVVDAPAKAGEYTAYLTYQAGAEHVETYTYTVVEREPRGTPAVGPAVGLGLLAAAAVARRSRA